MSGAVIYTRVSKDRSGEGASTERQETACRALCEARGWTVAEVVADVSYSAYSGVERPGWQQVLAMVEDGKVDRIVAWAVDRISRSMLDLEALIELSERTGVTVSTVSGDLDLSTDIGRMVGRILGAVARGESERKAARQRLAYAQTASKGRAHVARRPFGFEPDAETIREAEAEMIREGARDVLEGVPLGRVAKRWGMTHQGARALLLNPRYVGERWHKGEFAAKAVWPPILDRDTFLALRALFKSRPARNRRGGRTPTTLLSGLAVCAKCGEPVIAGSAAGTLTYTCRGKCFSLSRSQADELVEERAASWSDALESIGRLFAQPEVEVAEEVAEARAALATMTESAQVAGYGPDEVAAAVEPARERLEALEAIHGRTVEAVPGWIEERWEERSLASKRRFLAAVATVTMHGANRKKGVPVDQRVIVEPRF